MTLGNTDECRYKTLHDRQDIWRAADTAPPSSTPTNISKGTVGSYIDFSWKPIVSEMLVMYWASETQSDSFRVEIMGRTMTVIIVRLITGHMDKYYTENKRVSHQF